MTAQPAVDEEFGRNDVWSNYVGVWHLQETPPTVPADSTGNSASSTLGAGMTSDDSVAGKLGKAMEFDGTATDYVNGGNGFSINNTDPITECTWVKYNSSGSGWKNILAKSYSDGYAFDLYSSSTGGTIGMSIGSSSGGYTYYNQPNGSIAGSFHYVCALYNGSGDIGIYLDNSEISGGTTGSGTRYNDTNANMIIGAFNSGGLYPATAVIDEVRVSQLALSDNWRTTEYNNQNDQSSFFSNISDTPSSVISIAALAGFSPPVTGATPITNITETAEYTGEISWSPSGSPFATGTAYTATITINPKLGYTLTGVPENFFTISGATSVTNSANSGIVTATFPQTTSIASITWAGANSKSFNLRGTNGASIHVDWGDGTFNDYTLLGTSTDVLCSHTYTTCPALLLLKNR